ncbi:hypothetical protein CMI38_02780 [Candidatus Pacearchaeota archaeon]|nr:hypothetical protein [Candidatus Pacearchaeota archaeon]
MISKIYPRFIPPELEASISQVDGLTRSEWNQLDEEHRALLLKPLIELPFEGEQTVYDFLDNEVLKREAKEKVKGMGGASGEWDLIVTEKLAEKSGRYEAWLSGEHSAKKFDYEVGPVIAMKPNSKGTLTKIVMLEFSWSESGISHGRDAQKLGGYHVSSARCSKSISHNTYGDQVGHENCWDPEGTVESVAVREEPAFNQYAYQFGTFPYCSSPEMLEKNLAWGANQLSVFKVSPSRVEKEIVDALKKRDSIAKGILKELEVVRTG